MNNEKKINIKAVLIGWLVDTVGSFVVGVSIGIVAAIFMASKGVTQEQIAEELAHSKAFQNISLFVGFSFTFIGGYVSAFIAKTDELKHALLMGALSLIISLLLTSALSSQSQETSSYVILAFIIPFAVLGGYLRKITQKERTAISKKSDLN